MANLPNGYPRITPSSPVRDLGPGCMDYKCCATLHNKLLTRAVKAQGLEMPPNPRTWWEKFSPPEDIMEVLCEPLIEFYKRAYDTEVLGNRYLFYFLGGFIGVKYIMEGGGMRTDDPQRFLHLYQSSWFRVLDDEGLLFDQETGKATWIEDWSDTQAVSWHEWGWMPLEVILDAYLQMHDEGKAEALPASRLKDFKNKGPDPMDPWILHQYTETDINRTVAAFQRLINAIDSRLGNKKECTSGYMELPWHDPVTLTQDFIPRDSFAYRFLQAVSEWKVRFRYIAPGIRIPTASEFLDQPIKFPGNCPLRIFQNDTKHPVHDSVYNIDLPTGFYIDPVVQSGTLFWTNGCRVLLPFEIGANGWARQSNGQPFGVDNFDDNPNPKPKDRNGTVYQAGLTNGITNHHFVQIDKVFNNWAERVEMGDWDVTEDGVAGGIGKFKDADTEEHWKKYWIPPSW
ncbi:hypothetical protein BDW59DRAFT_150073 [Aspergillus cavernicola]|uniref:Uncharacterized protein n=1 Tax=Aspergillus cavernicola TaxID=176166 RepID=A0ABR4I0Z8_9EURO